MSPALLRGESHHRNAPPPTKLQRSLMALSSLMYLCPAFAWFHFDFAKIGSAFCMVALLSVIADSGGGIIPERIMVPSRVADRTVGTSSLLTSVYLNSNSILNFLLSFAAVLSSLCFLTSGRAWAQKHPRKRWTYLLLHGSWHVYGSFILVAVTFAAQAQAEPTSFSFSIGATCLIAAILIMYAERQM